MGAVIDQVTMQVVRYALEQIADEMGYTLVRTSRSTIIKEVMDITCAIFDAQGRTIAQAHHAPMLLTGFEITMVELIKRFPPGTLKEGDVVISNDPYLGGQHIMDIQTMAPVFFGGDLVGYVGAIAHQSDMGGAAPGGVAGGLTEIYQQGFTNLNIPEEYGGSGIDPLTALIITEEIARGCSAVATSSSCNSLATYPILIGGNEEQKQRFLRPIAEEGLYASFCLTEPGAGSDVASLSTIARKDGNKYIINGRKQFITSANVASFLTVFCQSGTAKGHSTISTLVFESNTPGVTIGRKERKMGLRASTTCEVIFEDVEVLVENLISGEGAGFKLAMETLNKARPTTGAMALGIAQAALEASVNYAKERIQFGKPIVQQQAVQMILADMAMKVETARLLVYKAGYLMAKGLPYTKESAMSKCYAADIAMEVSTDAVQIFKRVWLYKRLPGRKVYA